ncbi:glycosyltransferase family 2 protein [bacterium]|nr:glycosyltransferase family 2 protein [bacterium]
MISKLKPTNEAISGEILFSIIIPVYNTGIYLPICLESIINQNFKNIELICINDGSTDNSVEILNEYRNKDSRIKIINQNNHGAGFARNTALKYAQGKYICFLDSDDYLDKCFFSECIKQIDTNPDILIFGVKNTNSIFGTQYSSLFFDQKYNISNLFKYHTISYNKIYKRSFLIDNDIKFSNTKTGEDQIFTIKSMLYAEKINILKKDLYFYRKQRVGSLTHKKIKNDLSPIENFYIIEQFLQEYKPEEKLSYTILNRYLLKCISWYRKTDNDFSKTYYKHLKILLDYLKNKNGRYWWDYYHLVKCRMNSALIFEYLKSHFIWFIREKLVYVPAFILFFISTLRDFIQEKDND